MGATRKGEGAHTQTRECTSKPTLVKAMSSANAKAPTNPVAEGWKDQSDGSHHKHGPTKEYAPTEADRATRTMPMGKWLAPESPKWMFIQPQQTAAGGLDEQPV